MYSSGQLARAMSRPAKVQMGAAKNLLRYLAGTTDFTVVYKKGSFKLTALSDSNWGKNPGNGKSTSCYVINVVQGSGELQVRSSESDGNVHDGG